jgi:hypothetical protein
VLRHGAFFNVDILMHPYIPCFEEKGHDVVRGKQDHSFVDFLRLFVSIHPPTQEATDLPVGLHAYSLHFTEAVPKFRQVLTILLKSSIISISKEGRTYGEDHDCAQSVHPRSWSYKGDR